MIGGVRIRSAAVSLWISSALVTGCTAAHAEESGDHLQVEVIGCGNLLSPAALEEALGVELRGAEAQVSGYIQRARPRVRARCAAGEIIVEVIADDGVALQESVHTRRLGLPRFVAIAVAESVAARAAVLPAPLPKAPPPAPATPPPPPLPLAPRKPPRLVASIWAGGAALYGGTPGWWSGAAELGADLTLRSLVTLHLDLGVASGSLRVEVGSIEVVQPSAAIGVRLGKGFRWFRVEAGVAVRGGAVSWKGYSDRPEVIASAGVAAWLGPAADLLLAADLPRALRLRFHVEVGTPALSASADGLGSRFARLDPIWVTAGIGLGIRIVR